MAAEQLAQVFIFNSNSMADKNHPSRPKLPDGFPAHLLVYDRFADEPWRWHPRDVDRLTRDELFWLPIIKDAKMAAAESLAAARK